MSSDSMNAYESFRVPISGGEMAGGIWNPQASGPPVLAIHGITASHVSWTFLAQALPDTRIIAPDLRGRGRSNQLPGPYGMLRHANDMAELLDALGVDDAVVVGHSMGAFVTVRLAELHPARVRSLVLVDGGLPIPRPEKSDPTALLGPAAERLTQHFTSRAEYVAFWRPHPAFVEHWSPEVEAYLNYDLDETDSGFKPSARVGAVAQDVLQLNGEDGYTRALRAVDQPIEFLRAPRGLMDEPTALYSPEAVATWTDLPLLHTRDVADVNHYTIILTEAGARSVANTVRKHLALLTTDDDGAEDDGAQIQGGTR